MFWERICEWHRVFAWLPVQTETGEWLWWTEYERRSMRVGPTVLDIEWVNRVPQTEAHRQEVRHIKPDDIDQKDWDDALGLMIELGRVGVLSQTARGMVAKDLRANRTAYPPHPLPFDSSGGPPTPATGERAAKVSRTELRTVTMER